MKKPSRRSIGEIMADGKLVEAALRRSAREALRRHKAAGVAIVGWRDGKIVRIPPEDIKIPGEKRTRAR